MPLPTITTSNVSMSTSRSPGVRALDELSIDQQPELAHHLLLVHRLSAGGPKRSGSPALISVCHRRQNVRSCSSSVPQLDCPLCSRCMPRETSDHGTPARVRSPVWQ